MSIFFFKYSRLLFTICFFNVCSFFFAQNLTIKQIDTLLVTVEKERTDGNTLKYLDQQLLILKASQKINYSKGIAKSHYGMGLAFMTLGKSDKAIEQFTLTEKETYTKTDFPLLSETNRFLGECYSDIGLSDLAIEKHRKSIQVVENAGDDLIDYRKAINYNDIASILSDTEKPRDSNYYYLTKALFYIKRSPDHLKKYTKETKNSVTAIVSSNLGEHWDKRKNVDSANYYYLKALDLSKTTNNKIIEGTVLTMVGDFYLRNKKYSESVEYFKKGIQISKESHNSYHLRDSYKGIAEAYKSTGNEQKYIEYSQFYTTLNDSIAISEKKAIETSVKKIVKDEKTKHEKTKSKLYWIIGGILFSGMLLSVFAYWFHQNMKRKKESIISDSAQKLANNREIIQQKEEETQELKLKVNDFFDEVVQLAKENSPVFLTRFQEIYPEFGKKLLAINPALVTSELRFCGMLFLHFSTKDIAEYTFTSPKTVQNRKNSIRKKLNIPSEEDLYIWFKNL